MRSLPIWSGAAHSDELAGEAGVEAAPPLPDMSSLCSCHASLLSCQAVAANSCLLPAGAILDIRIVDLILSVHKPVGILYFHLDSQVGGMSLFEPSPPLSSLLLLPAAVSSPEH